MAVCPECGHEDLNRRRSAVGFAFGAILLMLGFLVALPTLGASMILCVVGVFMMVPRTRCPECGWSKRN